MSKHGEVTLRDGTTLLRSDVDRWLETVHSWSEAHSGPSETALVLRRVAARLMIVEKERDDARASLAGHGKASSITDADDALNRASDAVSDALHDAIYEMQECERLKAVAHGAIEAVRSEIAAGQHPFARMHDGLVAQSAARKTTAEGSALPLPLAGHGERDATREVVEAAKNYVRVVTSPPLSPYVEDNGRRGGSPWRELVDAVAALAMLEAR